MKIIKAKLFLAVIVLFGAYSCGFGGGKEKNDTKRVETNESASEEPVAPAEWRGWLPATEPQGYTLDAFVTDPYKNNQLYSALAVYKKGETFLRVQLVDGSTEKGRREIRDHLKIAALERDHSSEFGYEKTLERNGIKAKEEYLKAPGEYLIKFMLKDRYGVSVKSNLEKSNEIWNFIDRLNLKDIN